MTHFVQLVRPTSGEDHAAQSLADRSSHLWPDDPSEEVKMVRQLLGFGHERLIRLHVGQDAVEECGEIRVVM